MTMNDEEYQIVIENLKYKVRELENEVTYLRCTLEQVLAQRRYFERLYCERINERLKV